MPKVPAAIPSRTLPHPAVLAALATLLWACSGLDPTPTAETVSLRLPGVSATAPAAPDWILAPGSAQVQAAVRSIGDTRTVVAFVGEEVAPTDPSTPAAILDCAVAGVRAGYAGGRHRLLDFTESPDGQECRGYRLTAEDAGVPGGADRLYLVSARGRLCADAERDRIIRLEYSERRLSEEPLLASFEAEAEEFLRSLTVEP